VEDHALFSRVVTGIFGSQLSLNKRGDESTFSWNGLESSHLCRRLYHRPLVDYP
jgi:hypothetical protein